MLTEPPPSKETNHGVRIGRTNLPYVKVVLNTLDIWLFARDDPVLNSVCVLYTSTLKDQASCRLHLSNR